MQLRAARIARRPAGFGCCTRAGVLGLLVLAAACGPAGDGFDYDRAHRDPFGYAFSTDGLGAPGGVPVGAAYPGATPSPVPVRGGFASEIDAARRTTEAAAAGAGANATQRQQRQIRERVEGRAGDADARAIEAAGRERERMLRGSPLPGQVPGDVARDSQDAVLRETELRRAVELDAQRRAAADRRALDATRPDRSAFEASDAYGRRFMEGIAAPPRRRSLPVGRLPDLGPVTLP